MPTTPYLDNATLQRLVRAYRRNKQPDQSPAEKLGLALLAIAGGVWDKFRFTADRDDFCQQAVMHLLRRPVANVDIDLNLFSYFTTCAIRYGLKLRAAEHKERRRFATYAEELVDAGRPVEGGVVGRAGDAPDANQEEEEEDRLTSAFVEWLEAFREQVAGEMAAMQEGHMRSQESGDRRQETGDRSQRSHDQGPMTKDQGPAQRRAK